MKINISIDDVSPHPLSSVKVLERCHELIQDFKDIKFTLFVPVAYWRTMRQGTQTFSPLFIQDHPEFCNVLKSLPVENFEVCLHGLYHGIPGTSDNDEFQHLQYEDALRKFSQIQTIISEAGLKNIFKPVFRPPAWRMSPQSIMAAKDSGIRTLALSPKSYAKESYDGGDEKFGNVVYYVCNPPFDPLVSHASNEIVYHACEWDKNYLSENLAKDLKNWLMTQDGVEFCFIEDML